MATMVELDVPGATRLVGVAMSGIPIAIATSLMSGIPAAFTRPSSPGRHGEHAEVEGIFIDEDEAVLVDDVVTKLDSKLAAVRQLEETAGRKGIRVLCRHVAVVVDRAQGGDLVAAQSGLTIHSLIRLDREGLGVFRSALETTEYEFIQSYLKSPESFQDAALHAELRKLARGGN